MALNVIHLKFLISPVFLNHPFFLSRFLTLLTSLRILTLTFAKIRSIMVVDTPTSPTFPQAQSRRPVTPTALTSKQPANEALEDPITATVSLLKHLKYSVPPKVTSASNAKRVARFKRQPLFRRRHHLRRQIHR